MKFHTKLSVNTYIGSALGAPLLRANPSFQKRQILADLCTRTGGHLQGQALSKLGKSFSPAINHAKFDNFINASSVG